MIIYYPYVNLINKSGRLNSGRKTSEPRVKVKCDKCEKEFVDKESVFNKRLENIGKEYCGKCAKPIQTSLAGLKSTYDENGNLRENKGRFTSDRWNNLPDEEKKNRIKHNKKIVKDFHDFLNKNQEEKTKHYKKIFKNSAIGYISKGQREVFEILKDDGYELDGYVSGMRIDVVNKKKKIAIEYNGDFWHCNPRMWNEDDYNKVIGMTAKEKWNNDRNRRFFLRRLGYDVHVIWENDWIKNRNKIYKLLNKITDNNYEFEPWEYKKTKPLKGRTFEDIYGEEKAKILKKKMSLNKAGKRVKKTSIYEIITPKQGKFYVTHLSDWHKVINNSRSKLLKFNKISYSDEYELWDRKKFKLILNVECPYCGLTGDGSGSNMTRYHFGNCKQKK